MDCAQIIFQLSILLKPHKRSNENEMDTVWFFLTMKAPARKT